ncbi:MAG: 3-oxoacid CoA-transferase subunit B [Elusimicrobia bacterium]|nr:3-oxoacid CoA-transferase subunit B [Elusimicrobiota bacterium]
MSEEESRLRIARRIAKELPDNAVVNLGIGIPTLVSSFLPEGKGILLHSENGYIGLGAPPPAGQEDPDLVNAGGQAATLVPGSSCFDSSMSFAIVRGKHLDYTILGALEVDEEGNLANYMIPGKFVPGIGGAMDLSVGAKNVVIAMEHVNKHGEPKIVPKCTLPLTAAKEVNLIVTDLAFIRITPKGLVLEEIAEDTTLEEVIKKTSAKLIVSEKLGRF